VAGRFYFLQFLFNTLDHAKRVLAVTHDHDASDYLAFAVQLGHAAAKIRSEAHRADVLDADRGAVRRFERDVANVLDRFDVAATPDIVFGRADFEDLSADVVVGAPDFVDDLAAWGMP
jgi:hypothetical protein